ncbi:site-specific integrase [Shouchella lehensis]|uniref:Site-specific integrase n=1 Tax=Shouchella lehensis TaxID=300825 RepID=A0A4Y7WDK6_9BACI|nr:site-specific integrase [Shouchella lehensis]MBG9783562.1 hypothetical protein [Shouchella lehensis]TES45684.1 site-specific integrase [Shouchella lehensis]
MASFRKRGQTWTYQVLYKNPVTGEREYITKGGFKKKSDCKEAAAEVEKKINNNSYAKERKVTFQEFALEWFEEYEKQSNKPSTARARFYDIRHFINAFGAVELSKISARHYQDVLYQLRDQGFAHNTISGINGAGKMVFKRAMAQNILQSDPTQYVKLPRVKKTIEELESEKEVVKYLEKDQLSTFLHVAEEQGVDIDYFVFLLKAYSGMRVGELLALKWTDIDFTNGEINITKTYYNPQNRIKEFELLTPKNSSKRTIQIDEFVLGELKTLKKMMNEYKLRKGKEYNDQGFIFVDTNRTPGYPMIIKTVGRRMKRILKLAQLDESLTPHSLRHTHTSLLAEAGVSLEEIMERLGHKNDSVTRDVYLHVTKSRKKEAAVKFSNLMDSVRNKNSG